jgi:hypothetical protein
VGIRAFSIDDVRRLVSSEDIYLCLRAREAGFKIIMDPSVRLGHVGQFVYGRADMQVAKQAPTQELNYRRAHQL